MQHLILVVEDVEEVRDGILKLLGADGYRVTAAREPEEAIDKIVTEAPDLVLVGLGIPDKEIVQTVNNIRTQSGLDLNVPIVVFDFDALEEGEEVAIEVNIYLTRPDNFNQLRNLLRRLLT